MHTGEGVVGGDDYVGIDVHRAARIAASGHGGQVLLADGHLRAGAEDGLPQGVRLRDLGDHRLKDLARPERIFQLAIEGLPGEFPSIRTLETPTNLPVHRSGFIGRERDLARIKELLRGPGLLTLTGPGGPARANWPSERRRSCWMVVGWCLPGGASAHHRPAPRPLDHRRCGRCTGRGRPVLDTLRDHVREREMLLLLDNFEQVIDGASVAAELLAVAPRMRILATSGEPLRHRRTAAHRAACLTSRIYRRPLGPRT